MSIDQSTTETPAATGPAAPSGGGQPQPNNQTRPSSATFESLAVAGLIFGIFAMAVAVFAIGLAARAASDASKAVGNGGGGSGGGTAPATLEVDLADFSIKPKEAEISSGGDITIVNKGAVEHDLVVEDKKSALVEAGAKGDLKLEDLSPGTYEMYCDVPGHREAGMEGTLVVK